MGGGSLDKRNIMLTQKEYSLKAAVKFRVGES